MTPRRTLAVLLLAGVVAVAGFGGDSRHGAGGAALAQAQRNALYEQYVRVTSMTCSPGRRAEAFTYGDVPLCAPFDSIPAVDSAHFVDARRAIFLPPAEPVVALDLGGEPRVYPVRFLVFHEVVNDTVAGRPVVISFCPLCNSAVAYSRRVGGRTLTFGVSGQLDTANLEMFDRQTLTIWQQISGVGLVGPLAGTRLAQLPVTVVSFGSWRAAHPTGLVMTAPQGARLPRYPYGTDPYAGYDRSPEQQSPALQPAADPTQGLRSDPRLPPKWRVVGVATAHGSVAFPVPGRPGTVAVESARLGPVPLVAFFLYGTAQPDKSSRLAASPRGWAGTVWVSNLGLRRLSFAVRGAEVVETTTGSRFDFFGRAVSGPLAGTSLIPAPQETAFWFAWVHFHPSTAVAARPSLSRHAVAHR